MANLDDKYRGDGCGGINSGDVKDAVANGDLERGSDGFLHGDNGKVYDDTGKCVGED